VEALYLLIPLSVAIVGLAAWIFLRMSDSGQFDDMDGPAHSILLDDDRPAGDPATGGHDGDEAASAPRRSVSRKA
jgi:cbb3-type cytochrome oxidase maturation protein